MYHVYSQYEDGSRTELGILSESEFKDLMDNPISGYDFIDVIKDNGQYCKFMLTTEGWSIVDRRFLPEENPNLLDIVSEKKTKKGKFGQNDKVKGPKRFKRNFNQDAEKAIKKPHYMNAARGLDRKDQNYIPMYKKMEHKDSLPTADNVLKNAKGASSGVWKLSKRQVLELAGKYKFNIPNAKEKTKHLGSTGILMWRKNAKTYYLVKFSKHKFNK